VDKLAREEKLVVRLTGDMKDKIQTLADSVGVTMSAYVAFIMGQHVSQQNMLLAPLLEMVKAEMEKSLEVELPSEAVS
jgi:hypothetical protein